ncbi:MAG: UvrD-helicase domain-containing protein, partial [Muribaculaceae bacterium]|nr:UvrD-helicase domain-containing protein [Muribaculaceae bacterium]
MMGSENLTIYKASAGSGKTFRLAYEFIKHTLGRRDNTTGRYSLVTTQGVGANRHRSILAITFTNKATEEMKRRIVRELAVLAGAPLVRHRKSDYRTRLINEFRCTPDQLAQCASTALTNLLFDFNFFNVSTIDAFFQTVLRVFAHEAELSGNYEVEIADRYAIESVVNELCNRVIRDADREAADNDASDSRRLIHWLNTYMMSQINNGKSFSIFNRNSQLRSGLISFFTSLTGEDFKYHEQELMAYINRPELLLQFEQKLMQRRAELAAEIRADATAVIDTLDTTQGFTSRSLVAGLMPTLRQFAAGSFKLPSTVTRANTADEPECRFAAKPLRDGIVTPQLDAMIKTTLEKSFEYTELDMIARQIYNFGLFGRVMREISQYRRDNNLILLSDTNSLLREIIGENSTPFVYERVGLWLRHFLIDEFQDTSGLQWDNLRPLVANSIAEANDNLIIGDEKQCIYRFRNSDPTLLQSRVSREFAGRVRLEGNTSASNTNYRSSGTVVEFNNMLFSALSLRFGLTSLYANVRQDVHQTELPGYVSIKALTGSTLDGSFKTNAVLNMINEIARQLQSGYRQSDIAILVRSNSEADFVISQTLERAKDHPELQTLQFLSDDALTIGTNTSVQQIVNQLHSLNHPAGASLSDKYTTPEQFTAIIRETDRLQTAGMSRSEATGQAIKAYHNGTLSVTPNHEEQNSVFHSLFNTVEELIAELPEDARRRDTVYLSAFQDEVLDFMSRGQADLYSFLRWWDSRKDKAALASAPGLDAIRIMTIHKSKGLEFPCVHIPLLSGSLRSDRDTIRWYSTDGFKNFDKDIVPPMIPLASSSALSVTSFAAAYNKVLDDNLIDELNVLYVAFTRAVNELIVSYSAPASSKDSY